MRLTAIPALILTLVAVQTSGAGSVSAAAGAAHPFHALLVGQTSVRPCGPGVLCLTAHDAGHASPLGAVRLVGRARIYPSRTACAAGMGRGGAATFTVSLTMTAVTGGTVSAIGAGEACHSAMGTVSVFGYMIVGGSGRFAGAHGSGHARIIENARGAETVRLSGTLAAPGF